MLEVQYVPLLSTVLPHLLLGSLQHSPKTEVAKTQ